MPWATWSASWALKRRGRGDVKVLQQPPVSAGPPYNKQTRVSVQMWARTRTGLLQLPGTWDD